MYSLLHWTRSRLWFLDLDVCPLKGDLTIDIIVMMVTVVVWFHSFSICRFLNLVTRCSLFSGNSLWSFSTGQMLSSLSLLIIIILMLTIIIITLIDIVVIIIIIIFIITMITMMIRYHHVTVLIYCWYSFTEYTAPARWFVRMVMTMMTIMPRY